VSASEDRLRSLLIQGFTGDATAYHAFLKELSAHSRAFCAGSAGYFSATRIPANSIERCTRAAR